MPTVFIFRNTAVYTDTDNLFRTFSIGASVLDTEPSTSVPTEISSEAPTEVPSGLPDNPQETVFPQNQNPFRRGLSVAKTGTCIFTRMGKTENRWKTIKKRPIILEKTQKPVPGKRIFPITYVTLIKRGSDTENR